VSTSSSRECRQVTSRSVNAAASGSSDVRGVVRASSAQRTRRWSRRVATSYRAPSGDAVSAASTALDSCSATSARSGAVFSGTMPIVGSATSSPGGRGGCGATYLTSNDVCVRAVGPPIAEARSPEQYGMAVAKSSARITVAMVAATLLWRSRGSTRST
jgi:hypothetical protein